MTTQPKHADAIRTAIKDGTPSSLPFIDPVMDAEWHAWQNFVREWREIFPPDDDLNDARYTPIVVAIKLWGEHLSTLRAGQSPGVRLAAFEDAMEAYELVKHDFGDEG